MQEIPVQCLGQEDPLEKEMATHSSILAWEIPWTEEPGRLQSMRSQRVGQDLATKRKQQRVINHTKKNSYHLLQNFCELNPFVSLLAQSFNNLR